MKVLVVGSGGREHALVRRLNESPSVRQVYCVPGNAGIAMEASCIPGDIQRADEIASLAETLAADFTVAGPEAPLVAGMANAFAARGLAIVGPEAAAARLEGSKAFTKELLTSHHIPTAEFVSIESPDDVNRKIDRFGFPVAIKADGLAAGKGVIIAEDREQAASTALAMLAGEVVGKAGARIVLERHLSGREVSFILLTDGRKSVVFPPTQDHKRAYDGDRGPNTGGMGAYCDDAILSPELRSTIQDRILGPTLEALRDRGITYRGFLYAGLMITEEGPQVLEFNVRLGDPEAQPLLLRLDGDFGELLAAAARGELDPDAARWREGSSVCVVAASKGYPGKYEKGQIITGFREAEAGGATVFHAGTLLRDGRLVTAGGRVLGAAALGADLPAAVQTAYDGLSKIHFDGMHYRTDIAAKALVARH